MQKRCLFYQQNANKRTQHTIAARKANFSAKAHPRRCLSTLRMEVHLTQRKESVGFNIPQSLVHFVNNSKRYFLGCSISSGGVGENKCSYLSILLVIVWYSINDNDETMCCIRMWLKVSSFYSVFIRCESFLIYIDLTSKCGLKA